MDKTIEVVLVAVVVIATAAIMLFIFTGESSNFSDFISDAISGAEQDLEDTQGVDCSSLGSAECRSNSQCTWDTAFNQCVSS